VVSGVDPIGVDSINICSMKCSLKVETARYELATKTIVHDFIAWDCCPSSSFLQ